MTSKHGRHARNVGLALLALAALVGVAALGRCVSGVAVAHDLYGGMKNANGLDCCGGHDCVPADGICQADGREGVLWRGQCITAPSGLIAPSPDGRPAICLMHGGLDGNGQPRCIALPGSS